MAVVVGEVVVAGVVVAVAVVCFTVAEEEMVSPLPPATLRLTT